jgi:hypothetical protein
MRIIACIEDPEVIEKILQHLGLDSTEAGEPLPRVPPARVGLFDRDPRIHRHLIAAV